MNWHLSLLPKEKKLERLAKLAGPDPKARAVAAARQSAPPSQTGVPSYEFSFLLRKKTPSSS